MAVQASDFIAYLVTYNPGENDNRWPELPQDARRTESGLIVNEWWNVSNKAIQPGDRIFLLKQGDGSTGIMGSGKAISDASDKRPHWIPQRKAAGDMVRYIDVAWDTILDPEIEPLLSESEIRSDSLPQRLWNARNSGNRIEPAVAQQIENLWRIHIENVRGYLATCAAVTNEEEEEEFPEGRERWHLHRSHERHPELPRRAKEAATKRGQKLVCEICLFDFFAKYGEIGRDFIECHHTIPVSELKEGMKTKLKDVVLVCSNCHRMLHHRRPWLRVDELRTLLDRSA